MKEEKSLRPRVTIESKGQTTLKSITLEQYYKELMHETTVNTYQYAGSTEEKNMNTSCRK
ncbi:unnamed protein product [marine sediment metagenome]|uniref:Uncharacterized protein n=1 Tax=marine sediment metagenome TaxID=412755 RepID=X0XKC0_9ZZZZ